MASNIICLAVGRFDDQSIIADYIPNQTNRQLIHKEIYGLLSSKPEVEWTISSDSKFGLWSLMACNNFCYLFLGPRNYPSNLVNSLLFDVKTALKDTSHSPPEVLEVISKKYNKPNDKIKTLTSHVKQVQELAYVGIKRVMDNTEIAENISMKTEELASTSFLLNQESRRLAKQMYWKKLKLKIILGILVLSVFLYFIIPLVTDDN